MVSLNIWFLLLLPVLALTANDLVVQIQKPANEVPISVRKCCGKDEVMDQKATCVHILNNNDTKPWAPIFTNSRTLKLMKRADFPAYELVIGQPQCDIKELLKDVYDYPGAYDQLILLDTGVLRHRTHFEAPDENFREEEEDEDSFIPGHVEPYHIDYEYAPSHYCLEKVLMDAEQGQRSEVQIAILCTPEAERWWFDSEYIVKKILDPVLHGLAIICYLIISIVYFVLPPLRDLPGNILTTICMCMIVAQAADIVRIFTEFTNHVSFMVADVVMYLGLLGAFFWLNSFGYYIWKTFRSRNVFLRVTDRRKYCYYSGYAWGATLGMTAVALVAHFLFDEGKGIPISPHDQKTIGWLGIAMFFSPIAFTIIVDIFFYLSTGQTISRMSAYGRIHNKMKFSFEMFIKLFLVMTAAWLMLVLSWLRYDAIIYSNMVANALQAPLFLYICVLGQQRVMYLLKKTCCYRDCFCPCCRPDDDAPSDWGEEMLAMNANYNNY